MRTKFGLLVALLFTGVFACANGAYAAAVQTDKIHFTDKVDKETTSQLQTTFANVNVSGLPTTGKKPMPSLAGQTVTFTIGNTSFQGTADAKGKITTPFNATLRGSKFSLKYKGLPLIALLPLLTADGVDKTVAVHFNVTASMAGQATVVLVDKSVTLIYRAKNGNLTGKGAGTNAGPDSDTTSPFVVSTSPLNAATDALINRKISATFSEEMDATTLNATSMTLMQGTTPVAGTVSYVDTTAAFTPSSNLTPNTAYTATITSAVTDLAGNELASSYVWSFTTGATADSTPATVASTNPLNNATGVGINGAISAAFSEAMDPASITTATFTVLQGTTAVQGSVKYTVTAATFTPTAVLATDTVFTATLTTGAKDLAGNALAANFVWTFTTGATAAKGPAPVSLGVAGNFAILAKSGIDTVPTSAVTGDIAVSPAAASYITGFGLTADPSNVFSTSPQVTGKVYAADFAVPTPDNLTTAVSNMETAYTDAAGRPTPDFKDLGAGDISGLTLVPGLYKWGTGVSINTDVTLNGGPNDVWIFQVAQGITQANGAKIILSGGALPKNIFWQSAGVVTIGTTAHFEGVILSQTSITLDTGASINGRLLAQTAVTIKSSTVTQPAQ